MKKYGVALFLTLACVIAGVAVGQSNIPISALPNGGLLQQTDIVPMVRNGTTMKAQPYIWPSSGSIMLSNGTSAPAGLPPINGNCVVGANGAWTSGACTFGTVTSISVSGASGIGVTGSPIVNSGTIGLSLGNITPTTVNKLTITPPATGSTLAVADGKTLTASNTLTFAGTDSSTLNIGTGGTLGTAAYKNTGTSGGTVPLLNAANVWSAAQSFNSSDLILNGSTSGTTTLNSGAMAGTSVLTLPVATDTLVGKATPDTFTNKSISGSTNTLTAIGNGSLTNSSITIAGHSVALGGTQTLACADLSNGATGCSTAIGTSGATIPLLNTINTWSAGQSFNVNDFSLNGSTSGSIKLNAAAIAGTNTITFPAGTTDFSGTGGASQVVQQTLSGGALTVGQLAASNLSNGTIGSGTIVLATSPTLVTPVLGAASATSLTFSSTSGVIGTTANTAAAAGSVGEILKTSIAQGSAVSLTSATNANVVFQDFTAGDWLLTSDVCFTGGATTTVSTLTGSISATSSTTDFAGGRFIQDSFPSTTVLVQSGDFCVKVGPAEFNFSSTTRLYSVAVAQFATSTLKAYGIITGQRIR